MARSRQPSNQVHEHLIGEATRAVGTGARPRRSLPHHCRRFFGARATGECNSRFTRKILPLAPSVGGNRPRQSLRQSAYMNGVDTALHPPANGPRAWARRAMAFGAALLLLAMLAPAPARASQALGEIYAAASSAPAFVLRAGDGPALLSAGRAKPIAAPVLDGVDDTLTPAALGASAQYFISARARAHTAHSGAPVARGFNARAPPGQSHAA